MLANPVFEVYDAARLEQIRENYRMGGVDEKYIKQPAERCPLVGTGLVFTGSFNLEHSILGIDYEMIDGFMIDIKNSGTYLYADRSAWQRMPEDAVIKSSSGVCDAPSQVLNLYRVELDRPDVNYCISFTPVYRDDQPKKDGWRWEKWGEYIGGFESQATYLADEPEIKRVLVYNIYQLGVSEQPTATVDQALATIDPEAEIIR